jgi:hypothetical protein
VRVAGTVAEARHVVWVGALRVQNFIALIEAGSYVSQSCVSVGCTGSDRINAATFVASEIT